MRISTILLMAVLLASCGGSSSEPNGTNQHAIASEPPPATGVANTANKPMPFSSSSCEELARRIQMIQDARPAPTASPAYINERFVISAVQAIRDMGFDSDATLQSLAFVLIEPRGDCSAAQFLIPEDLALARTAGLISKDTEDFLSEAKRFSSVHDEKVKALIDAVAQCSAEIGRLCEIRDLARIFITPSSKYGGKTMQQLMKDSQLFGGWVEDTFGCSLPHDMQFFLGSDGKEPTCRSFENEKFQLSVNQSTVVSYKQFKAAAAQRKVRLGL